MKVEQLDTPALVVDLDVMERNLEKMSAYCREHGLALCPHTKTHKSPWLAGLQMQLGAGAITVAKIGEAEVMTEAAPDRLLLAYPVWGASKANRLSAVARRTRLSVALDSLAAARWTSKAADGTRIGVLIEIDFGMRRCGLPPGEEAVVLAREIERLPGLFFEGLLFYSGHVHPDLDGNTRTLDRLNAELGRQLKLFEKEGIPVQRVSGGSTPSAYYSHRIDQLGEIRPGTYIYNDRNTIHWRACSEEDCAAVIRTTVISNAVPGQAIIDGGSKTFSSDSLISGTGSGYGLVKGHPGIEFFRMNEEHGYLRLPEGLKLEVGQPLEVIPNHICAAVNLHETAWGHRLGEIEKEWAIAARGKIR